MYLRPREGARIAGEEAGVAAAASRTGGEAGEEWRHR